MASKTFREYVNGFWEWFPTLAGQIHEELNQGNIEGTVETFRDEMKERLPNLSWVFGPGKSGGHSLTVTGEGQIGKQLLAADWLAHAPELPGWSFYAARQPSTRDQNEDAAIRIGGKEMNLKDVQIALEVNEENQRVDIQAWHTMFDEVEEEGRWQILFLFLDEVLGEYGTQMWIGEIEFQEAAEAVNLIDLPMHLNRIEDQFEWEKHSPLDEYAGYAAENPEPNGRRGDVIAGYTLFPQLVFQYAHQGPLADDPVEGTGAEFIYLSIDARHFPEDDPLGGRDEIERTLASELGDSALFFGGATGTEKSYLDVLLLDGQRSREQIITAMQAMGIDSGFEIISFTK